MLYNCGVEIKIHCYFTSILGYRHILSFCLKKKQLIFEEEKIIIGQRNDMLVMYPTKACKSHLSTTIYEYEILISLFHLELLLE